MDFLDGKLLVASPFLGDGNFNKSVILVIQHSEEGAFGLVLNRPTNHRLDDVWQAVADHSCDTDAVIHCGGPVESPLMVVHTQPSSSEHRILSGIHFATSKENISEVIQESKKPFRVFSGYAGWGAEQLESELNEGAWLIHSACFDSVFADQETDLWKNLAQEISKEMVMEHLNIKHFPSDPTLN